MVEWQEIDTEGLEELMDNPGLADGCYVVETDSHGVVRHTCFDVVNNRVFCHIGLYDVVRFAKIA